jgi:hypothetical protein
MLPINDRRGNSDIERNKEGGERENEERNRERLRKKTSPKDSVPRRWLFFINTHVVL